MLHDLLKQVLPSRLTLTLPGMEALAAVLENARSCIMFPIGSG